MSGPHPTAQPPNFTKPRFCAWGLSHLRLLKLKSEFVLSLQATLRRYTLTFIQMLHVSQASARGAVHGAVFSNLGPFSPRPQCTSIARPPGRVASR